MKTKVSQTITALLELQRKGYFDISLIYEGNFFRLRIYKGKFELQKLPVYYESIELPGEEGKLDEVFNMVEALKAVPVKDTNNVMITSFQCYKQEFVNGEKSGKWIKILPVIEYGDNATQSMLIDGSGYYLNDPDNNMLYFVDYEINKTE
ncbi:MAG: hypothetical protein LBL04_10400 [Bacteroidales bacterium]|jgi:hypothetical protein|nr:hypothetical protein [Bacteroidales bacterium]